MFRDRAAALLLVTLFSSGLPGCAPPRHRSDLRSGNPLDRAQGVVRAAEARDPRAVHRLVDLLEDPDSGVRFYAINALRRLFGVDYDYQYYQPAPQRAVAVARWRAAIRDGSVQFARRAASANEPAGEAPPPDGSAGLPPTESPAGGDGP